MTSERIYRPRAICELTIPAYEKNFTLSAQAHGSNAVTIRVICKSVKLTKNDISHADTLDIEFDALDAGLADPRFLKSATCKLWIGDAGPSQHLIADDSTLQFTGICVKCSRTAGSNGGFEYHLTFDDYTSFFLNQKPFMTKYIPGYGDTILEAWQKICSGVGFIDRNAGKIITSVELFKNRLVFPQQFATTGLDAQGNVTTTAVKNATKDTVIGKSTVIPQIQKFGLPDFANGKSAWDIWTYLMAALGLVTFIDKDTCVVTTTTEHFSVDKAPVLAWGDTLEELEESADISHTVKGICLSSFDGVTGKVITAYSPNVNDPRLFVKRSKATSSKAIKTPATDPNTADYSTLELNGIYNEAALQLAADRVWEEYGRQECQGKLKTREMSVENADRETFDLLQLSAGDPIRVRIDETAKTVLGSPDVGNDYKLEFLIKSRGYSPDVAQFLVNGADAIQTLKSDFHVRTSTISLTEHEFSIEITYCNLIDISGSTTEPLKK